MSVETARPTGCSSSLVMVIQSHLREEFADCRTVVLSNCSAPLPILGLSFGVKWEISIVKGGVKSGE